MALSDLVEILARLDFLVETSKGWSLQDKDTEDRTEKLLGALVYGLENQYTKNQIRNRLWDVFRNGYTHPEYNFPRLFLHGSSEIQGLGAKTKNLVEERLKVLRMQAPRSRRARSILPAPVATPSKDRLKSSTPSTRSKTRNRGNRRNRRNRHKKAVQGDGSLFEALPLAHSMPQGRKTQFTVIIPSTEIDDTEIGETPFGSPLTFHSEGPLADGGRLSDAKPIRRPTPVHPDSDHSTTTSESRRTTDIACLTPILAKPDLELVSELAHYKRRFEDSERDRTNLEKRLRQKDSFLAQTKGIPEKMAMEVDKKNQQIISLKKRVDEQIDLAPYLFIQNCQVPAPTRQQLHSDFSHMKKQLASILVLNSAYKPSIASLYGQSIDLNDLLHTVFDVGGRSNAEGRSNGLPDLTLYELIQALTGAAIHHWIFGSEYQPIAMMETMLLQKYRDHIATLCGHESLCNLDTAAHQFIIEEKDFKEVTVPRMASKHTTRLLKALQPLFDKQSLYKTTSELKDQLDHIFRLAIRVRSLSLNGTEDYQSVWPSSGSSFNYNEMETQHSGQNFRTSLVRVPLSPGLRVYPKKRAMVRYHPFGNGEETSRTPEYVIKALVLD